MTLESKLQALVKAAVLLAMARHDLSADDLGAEWVADDTWLALNGIGTCSEGCVPELEALLAERQEPPVDGDLRVALERIAAGELNAAVEICNCTHDDENCCEKVGEFCPQCIAATALKLAAAPSSGTGETK